MKYFSSFLSYLWSLNICSKTHFVSFSTYDYSLYYLSFFNFFFKRFATYGCRHPCFLNNNAYWKFLIWGIVGSYVHSLVLFQLLKAFLIQTDIDKGIFLNKSNLFSLVWLSTLWRILARNLLNVLTAGNDSRSEVTWIHTWSFTEMRCHMNVLAARLSSGKTNYISNLSLVRLEWLSVLFNKIFFFKFT